MEEFNTLADTVIKKQTLKEILLCTIMNHLMINLRMNFSDFPIEYP